MAERRFSETTRIEAARHMLRFFEDGGLATGWLVRDAADCVLQPFYAALDDEGRLCWTDDPTRARRFSTKQQAECFAIDRAIFDVRVVKGR